MIGALVAGITGSGGASLSSYESIATANATGSTNFVDLTSIPSTFKHLQVRGIARDGVGYKMFMRINSDTGANYAWHELLGNGSAIGAYGVASDTKIQAVDTLGTTANNFAVFVIDILDYASTSKNKTVRITSGFDVNGSGNVRVSSGLWMSTSAITALRFYDEAGATNLASGSSFALYGIKEA